MSNGKTIGQDQHERLVRRIQQAEEAGDHASDGSVFALPEICNDASHVPEGHPHIYTGMGVILGAYKLDDF